MKILLTHAYFLEEDEKEKNILKPYPPLGILCIAAWLEEKGYPCEVFDSTFSTSEKLKQKILVDKPDLIGIYTNLMTKIKVIELVAFIKENSPKTRVLLGGPEIRYNAENYLKAGADFLIPGEGETSTLQLLEYLEGKREIREVVGLIYKDVQGDMQKNALEEKIKDLDVLPFPARDKIDLNRYFTLWKEKHGKSAVSISSMRGCPYTCKWCSRSVYGLSYRRRSPQKVVDEMLHIKSRYEVDTAWFVDDVFTISHKWLAEFTELVTAQNAVIPYECISRADRLNEEVFAMLKKSGCYRVWIGAESGSQRVIDLMDRRVSVESTREMIRMAGRFGIEAGTFIMLGYPGEKEVDILETTRHLKLSDPDYFTITVAYPINGTPLYQEIEADIITDKSWQNRSDRDLDFKRSYSGKYYQYAVRYVNNAVQAHKAAKSGRQKDFIKFTVKKMLSRGGMWVNRPLAKARGN